MAIIYFAQYTSPQKGPIGYRWHIAAPQLPALFLDELKEALDSHNAFPEDGRTLPEKFCGGLFLSASMNLGAVFRFMPGQPDAAGRSGKVVLNCLCFFVGECQGKSLRPLRESPVLSDCTEENRRTEMSMTIPLICNDVFASSEKNFDHFLKENLNQDQLILLKNDVIHSYTKTNRSNFKMPQPFVSSANQDKMYNPPNQRFSGGQWKCHLVVLLIGVVIGLVLGHLWFKGQATSYPPSSAELLPNNIYLKTEETWIELGKVDPSKRTLIYNLDSISQINSLLEKAAPQSAKTEYPPQTQLNGETNGQSR